MKIVDTSGVKLGQPPTGGVPESNAVSVAEPAAARAAADRISTDDANQLAASVTSGMSLAAGERALRLQSLTQQVRSGTYTPNVSQLAQEILAQAELDAHLAQALH